MNRFKVAISSNAIEDLRDIHAYIALSLQSPQSAKNQLDRIRKAIHALDTYPLRHKLVDWEPWASMNVRQLPVDHYVVFYIVDTENSTVSVLRIFYGGRDVERIIQNYTES